MPKKSHFLIKTVLIICIFLVSCSVFGQKVRLVRKNKAIILIKKGQRFKKNIEYEATGKKSDATFKVLRQKGRKIVVKFYNGNLYKNDIIKIEEALSMEMDDEDLLEDQSNDSNQSKPKKRKEGDYQHYLSLGYDITNTGIFKGVTSSDSLETIDVDFNFESGFSIGYEYRKSEPYSWGAGYGVSYHLAKNLKSLTIGGEEYEVTEDPPNLSVLRLYRNTIYRWDTFYIPFGINITSMNYTPAKSYTGTLDSVGGVGFNFITGWHIGANARIEYGASSNFWTLKSTDGTSVVDYGTGMMIMNTLKLLIRFGN